MLSFSPAGMAVKAFFGRGARTFGNPRGAYAGTGGAGVAPALTFTRVAAVNNPLSGVARVNAFSSNTNAVTPGVLAVGANGAVISSLNGGAAWAALSNVGAAYPHANLVASANGTICYGGGNFVPRSADHGATWTAEALPIVGFGTNSIATDGAGNWIVFTNSGGTANYARSVNDGVTWTAAGTYNSGGVVQEFVTAWDSTDKFVAATSDGNLASSPDGNTYTVQGSFTAGAIAITFLGVFSSGVWIGGFPGVLALGGTLAAALAFSNSVNLVHTGLSGNLIGMGGDQPAALVVAIDDAGHVAQSNNGITWILCSITLVATEVLACLYVDPIHRRVMVGGSLGNIYTAAY